MDKSVSQLDICHRLMQSFRRDGYRIRAWHFNHATWREIALEARPTEIMVEITNTMSLFGLPVDVSDEYPGISLVIF